MAHRTIPLKGKVGRETDSRHDTLFTTIANNESGSLAGLGEGLRETLEARGSEYS